MYSLPLEERDRRWSKVREAMGKRSLGALIVWGSLGFNGNYCGNLRYLTNFKIEGYLVFPDGAPPSLFTFTGSSAPSSPFLWVSDWRTGHPRYARVMAAMLRELHLEKAGIGLVGLSGYYGEFGFPHAAYASLIAGFPEAHFEDATDIVEDCRRVKSAAELKCFDLGCQAAEVVFGTIGSAARVGATDFEVKMKLTDALVKNGCDPDSMVLYGSGKELYHASRGRFLETKHVEKGDVILTEFDARFLGYKAQFNQAFSVGTPDREWSNIFKTCVASFESGLKVLKPGITAGELEEAFHAPIRKAGYSHRFPAFHGLGLSLEEPIGSFPLQPEHKLKSSMVIQAGMVLEFEPHVVAPDEKKGISFGCPVLVADTGCAVIPRNWKPEFPDLS